MVFYVGADNGDVYVLFQKFKIIVENRTVPARIYIKLLMQLKILFCIRRIVRTADYFVHILVKSEKVQHIIDVNVRDSDYCNAQFFHDNATSVLKRGFKAYNLACLYGFGYLAHYFKHVARVFG